MTRGDNKQPVGVALIGAGMIAKTHVAALSAAQNKARLKAIVSQHPDRARPLAAHYAGDAPVFTSDLRTKLPSTIMTFIFQFLIGREKVID